MPRRTRTPWKNVTIPGRVPGDLVSDLANAKLIPNPIFETTWRDNSSWWDGQVWTYTTVFELDKALVEESRELSSASSPLGYALVFEGVKMAANVSLNDNFLGTLLNQFVRYSFDVTSIISRNKSNTLRVVFDYHYDVATNGRFMACTGGWDWAPVSTTTDLSGHPTFTRGIWKSVYIVATSSILLTHVVPQIIYAGTYPLQRLHDSDPNVVFNVTMQVFLDAQLTVSGTLAAVGEWAPQVYHKAHIELSPGSSQHDILFQVAAVKLWWPAHMGAQTLYNINVSFTPDYAGAAIVHTSRSVGFRVVALVTGNDTDPSFVSQAGEGTRNYTLMFRVNGAAMWVRGANLIPMEELEGRADAQALIRLVASAAEGGMNMLRIWGGGIFQVWLRAAIEYI